MNPGPIGYEPTALTTELKALNLYHCYEKNGDLYGTRTRVTAVKGRCLNRLTKRSQLVGVTGFEPAAPCSQSTCATKLRHTPAMEAVPHKQQKDYSMRAPGLSIPWRVIILKFPASTGLWRGRGGKGAGGSGGSPERVVGPDRRPARRSRIDCNPAQISKN